MEETLGKRIRKTRKAMGMSLNELTQRCGASPGAIWRIERDEITNPHADRVIALAKALRVTSDYLLGIKEQP